MFLADAVAAYVESLTERELDAPLLALLQRLGFDHVHLVHGGSEYGKDLIARRVENDVCYQYCLQSKAGDLNARGWREVRLQVDEMRTGRVVHPDFDPDLPRRLVVVTNGRLVGTAGVSFQDYNDHHRARGEATADFWGIDFLVPQFEAILVEGVPATDRARTLEMLGRLGQGRGGRLDLREYARPWFRAGLSRADRWGHVLTGAMLAKEAAAQGREDLSAQVAFLLLRVAWEAPPAAGVPDEAELVVARRIFAVHAAQFWEAVRASDPLELTTRSRSGLDLFVIHPVKAARLCEQLCLLGVLAHAEKDIGLRDEIADYIERFVNASLAGAHPVSDEWAYSLLVAVVFLLITARRETAYGLLRHAAVWLLDRVEHGRGLAHADDSAFGAVRRLLGPAYPGMVPDHEPSAYAFAVVLDLAYLCRYDELYRDLLNDLDAVDAFATCVVERTSKSGELVARLSYSSDQDPPAAHHVVPVDSTPQGAAGAYFDCLADWATKRDRHVPAVLAGLLASGSPPE